ncbi:hypothetical protein [Fontivita pretiosa]|uniref:hypothetical protein n=1 Tax=Fontivita pretiosa TaxID=2989684 RepID=UPI003D185268
MTPNKPSFHDQPSLPYERCPKVSLRRRICRAVCAVVLVALVALCPCSQLLFVFAFQDANWRWNNTVVRFTSALVLERLGMHFSVGIHSATNPDEGTVINTLKTSRLKPFTIGIGHFLFRSPIPGFGPHPNIKIVIGYHFDQPPILDAAALGWRLKLDSITDANTRTSWVTRDRSVEAVVPSWFLALLSISSAVVLWRKVRQWRHEQSPKVAREATEKGP